MAHPAAVVFAITMAIWVADARLTPEPSAPQTVSTCKSGPTATPPEGADLELVVCAPPVR